MRKKPNIFSIPPGCNFLKTLAEALISGKLVEGLDGFADPLGIADATIYLPTRRAARGLAVELLEAMGKDAAILPTIRTLGDPDVEDLVLEFGKEVATAPEQMGGLERRLALYRLIQGWTDTLSSQTLALFGEEDLAIPSSPADALWLAEDLTKLIDQLITEEIDWQSITNLCSNTQPQWWQLTLEFLQIVITAWPQYLDEVGKTEAAEVRTKLLDQRSDLYRKVGSAGPVIIAGSTGTIPATQRFMQAVATLENGAVVLPGLDHHLHEADWKQLVTAEKMDELATTPNQPQYGLAHLTQAMGVLRDDICNLGVPEASLQNRERIFSLAMAPAENSDHWIDHAATIEFGDGDGLDGIGVIEASNEIEEGLAIAICLREALEQEGGTAALITPDRKIAKRVATELARFGIEIDDSGGNALRDTPVVLFFRHLLEVTMRDYSATSLVSLLKHPISKLGLPSPRSMEMANIFELALVRGQTNLPVVGSFVTTVAEIRSRVEKSGASIADQGGALNHRLSDKVRGITPDNWDKLSVYCEQLDQILQPLGSLKTGQAHLSLDAIMDTIRIAAIDMSVDSDGIEDCFTTGDGAAVAEIFTQFSQLNSGLPSIKAADFPAFFEALLGDGVIRNPASRSHPRLHILGPLEARLHAYDRVIVAGLNEGTWPPKTKSDPFLNRVMRGQLGLDPPERKIGLAAHDFQQLAGNSQFYISRSTQVDHAPTVASRWVQRLASIIGKDRFNQMKGRGERYVNLAKCIDVTPKSEVISAPRAGLRPAPAPPLEARPKSFSVTEIETWIRDPYAIYARKILKLSPLEPLEMETNAALRGTLYHAVFARFVLLGIDPNSPQSLPRLLELAETVFTEANLPREIQLVWFPRLQEIAERYIDWERERADLIQQSSAEISGQMKIGEDFYLRARADRIDIDGDNLLRILDYKTGNNPSLAEARTRSPQLPLEAAIARNGGFEGIAAQDVSSLSFVRLKTGAGFKEQAIENAKISAEDIIEQTLDLLHEHVEAYRDPAQGYLSRFAPLKSKQLDGDYDHLARAREWSTSGVEDD